MKEWGLCANYREYLELPEPVKVIWRLAAGAEGEMLTSADTSKPTQDLLAMAIEEEARERVSV